MTESDSCRVRVEACLRRFLDSTGRKAVGFGDRTNLARDLGMTSDEGVDFVLDLCEEFGVDLPHDFNPVAHESGRRGRRVGELVDAVASLIPAEEAQQ